MTMPTSTIHTVLRELGLLLPMHPDTCWTLTHIDDAADVPPTLRVTLVACGDLVIETHDDAHAEARYVFNETGHLVSVHQCGAVHEPALGVYRPQVIHQLRGRCVGRAHQQ